MKAFEVTLKGFYSGNEMTDDLILWVAAHSSEAIYMAAAGSSFKIRDVDHTSDLSVEDCEWTLPRDAAEMAIAVAERAIIYRDKEIAAIDGNRVVVWNEQRQDFAILSYGPESIAYHRLSQREKQLLIKYEIDLDSLQSPQP